MEMNFPTIPNKNSVVGIKLISKFNEDQKLP